MESLKRFRTRRDYELPTHMEFRRSVFEWLRIAAATEKILTTLYSCTLQCSSLGIEFCVLHIDLIKK